MRLILLLFCLVCSVALIQAQPAGRRLVVIEEFTSATCGPCVDADKTLKTVVNLDSGIVALKYHLNIPTPGDPFYKSNPQQNDKRGSLYGIPALPAARVNGYRGVDPRDAAAMRAAARVDQSLPYPVEIKVNHDAATSKVQVEVQSAVELKDYILITAVYAQDVKLPNLPKEIANSNGQTEFSLAMLSMLPNENGAQWNMAAGEKKTVEYTYTAGTSQVWQQPYQAIAFLQNPRTSEIIQAGISDIRTPGSMISTTISYPPTISPVFTVKNPGEKVELSAVIGNVSASPITYTNVQIQKSARTPADWTLSVSGADTSFVLQPGQSRQISLALQRSANPGIGQILLSVTEQESGLIYNAVPVTVISRETEGFLITDNPGNLTAPFDQALTDPAGAKRYVPVSPREFTQNAAEFTSMKRLIWNCADSGRIDRAESDFIIGLMQKGVSALISGQFLTNNLFFDKIPLLDTLGITYGGFVLRNANFRLSGTAGDTISDGFNQPATLRSYPVYPIKPKTASVAAPLLRYGTSSSDTLTGIRIQQLTFRAVYLGINPLIINDSVARRTLIARSLDWLAGFTFTARPALAASIGAIDFGLYDAGTIKPTTFDISNSGNVSTVIDSVKLEGKSASEFTLTKGAIALTLPAGAKAQITVEYKPMNAGTHNAEIVLYTSTPGVENIRIPVSGIYAPGAAREDAAKAGIQLISMQSADFIALPAELPVSLSIYDLSGALRYQQSIVGSQFQLPAFTPGIYMLRIKLPTGIYHLPWNCQ